MNSTLAYGLLHQFDEKDRGALECTAWTDSDHGADPDSRRSTGAWLSAITGNNSHMSIAWSSKIGRGVALSTGHAEVVPVNDLVKPMRHLFTANYLDLVFLARRLYGEKFAARTLVDSSAAISAINGGGAGSRLAYLTKYEGIDLSFLQSIFTDSEHDHGVDSVNREDFRIELAQVPSADNLADLGTKALDAQTFSFLRQLSFIRSAAELRVCEKVP